jgi:4-amino-4-deoxy-L-arabinose transferase-like glycosyltransferase
MPVPAAANMLKTHQFFLGLLVGILIFFSCYQLTESPPLWFDEGIYSQVAMNLDELGKQVVQVAPEKYVSTSYITVGYPLLAPVAVFYKFFGIGIEEGRAVMVVFIVALALLAYLLIKKLSNEMSALWALALLATFPMLYGNGKTVIGEVPGLFFLFATLYALRYVENTNYKDWRGYVAVGVAAGLCVATKPIFILLLGALFVAYVFYFKKISLNYRGVIVGLLALFIPLALWVFLQFGPEVSMRNVISIYSNPSATEHLRTVVLENAKRFFTESTPIYTAGIMVIWTLALLIRRKAKNISSAELAAFFFCVLILGSFLRMEGGWYRYIFPATIVALPFFPYACTTVWEALQKKIHVLARLHWLPYVFITLLVLAQFYQTAFTSFAAEYFTSTRSQTISTALKVIDPRANVFLYNSPEVAILLPSRNYYQYLSVSKRISLGAGSLAVLRSGLPDIVIVSAAEYQKNVALFSRYSVSKDVEQFKLLSKK